jgi:hypothetical protein
MELRVWICGSCRAITGWPEFPGIAQAIRPCKNLVSPNAPFGRPILECGGSLIVTDLAFNVVLPTLGTANASPEAQKRPAGRTKDA